MNEDQIGKELAEIMAFQSEKDREAFEAEKLHLRVMGIIRERMEEIGMNRKELADRLGTSKAYVSQLFSGDTLINFKTLSKMEVILGGRFKIQFVSNYSAFDSAQNDIGFSIAAEPDGE